jgi:hypothetical protein
MKNQTITIVVSEGDRWLNIDGDKSLLNALIAVIRGEQGQGPDTKQQPVTAVTGQGGDNADRE